MENTLLWLWLQHTACITRAKQQHLKAHFGDIETIYKSDAASYRQAGFLDSESIERLLNKDLNPSREMLSALGRISAGVITCDMSEYPAMLREINGAPNIIYHRGSFCEFNTALCLAMVGARKASPYGSTCAFNLSRSLSQNGVVVVSGMASGIDAKSHEGALSGGSPTVAVLGTGVDTAYPRSNSRLMQDIMKNGAVISEYPIGSAAEKYHFPERNRIISGISSGTIVVEADIKSGSLITAKYALEQNRDIFAVPGNINNTLSKGSNYLLKDGAHMVTCAGDVLDFYGVCASEEAKKPLNTAQNEPLSPEDKILFAIGDDIVLTDTICQKTGLDTGTVNASLLMLEINGKVLRHAGGYYSQTKSM